jgi:hypothetical protein
MCLAFFAVLFGVGLGGVFSNGLAKNLRLVMHFFSVFFLLFGAWYLQQSTAKKAKHIIALLKPKTEDCQALNTFVQLKTLLTSHTSEVFGFSANEIRSIICINDAIAPSAALAVSMSHVF